MPFKSKKQEDYLRINEPEVYKRWKKRYNNGGVGVSAGVGPITLTLTPNELQGTIPGPTTVQGTVPFSKNEDASVLIEQEVYVDKDTRVYLNMWDKEGAGGAGIGITATGENWDVNATHTGDDTSISGRFVKRFNKGGRNGCPMDGAVIKGGTTIKPDRYKNGKRKV